MKNNLKNRVDEAGDTKLRTGLLRALRTSTQAKIAKLSGVSTRTVRDILYGDYASNPVSNSGQISLKQMRAWVEVITRLAVYLQIEPEVALREYGFDPGLEDVQVWMTGIQQKPHRSRSPDEDAVRNLQEDYEALSDELADLKRVVVDLRDQQNKVVDRLLGAIEKLAGK